MSKCKEFSDVKLRVTEKKVLNGLNKDKNKQTIRYKSISFLVFLFGGVGGGRDWALVNCG